MITAGSRRLEIVDALRGLALFGILQVNIQSYTWGSGPVLGFLATPPETGEPLLYFLQAALFSGKFYPIFGFLFGASMALQLRSLRRTQPGGTPAAQARMARRLAVLFGMGLAHGVLLYFGDVLCAYALCGYAFLRLAPQRPAALAQFVAAAWVVAAATELLPLTAEWMGGSPGPAAELPGAAVLAHKIYTEGGFLDALRQRWDDEVWQQLGSAIAFWPHVIALLGLGQFAVRRGWLRSPQRHPQVWRRAHLLGWGLGLPCALAGAALSLQRLRTAPGSYGGWDDVLLGVSSVLACGYVALAIDFLRRDAMTPLRAWLASAGRMSLTHYVGQSLAMALLLSGWGLHLGAHATRWQLALLGMAIFVFQVMLGRRVLKSHGQGPLEALWRRWTYG